MLGINVTAKKNAIGINSADDQNLANQKISENSPDRFVSKKAAKTGEQ